MRTTKHFSRRRSLHGSSVALAALICSGLLVGCGGEPGDAPSKPSASRIPGSAAPSTPGVPSPSSGPTSTPTAESTGEPTGAPSDNESVRRLATAGATAVGAVDGATVISIERDDNRWEVELADSAGDEHDVTVSADGSEVQSGPRKDEQDGDDRGKNLRRVADAKLDFAAAAEAAVGKVPDAEVDDVSLDNHRDGSGPTVWDVNLRGADGQEHDLVIDAGDGSVLEHETDD